MHDQMAVQLNPEKNPETLAEHLSGEPVHVTSLEECIQGLVAQKHLHCWNEELDRRLRPLSTKDSAHSLLQQISQCLGYETEVCLRTRSI